MGKKKTTEKELELVTKSKHLKEFISDSVDGMSIHDGISVMCVADAQMLHEFAMNAVDDVDDVDEYLRSLETFTDFYKNTLKLVISVQVKETKEKVKISNHGNRN